MPRNYGKSSEKEARSSFPLASNSVPAGSKPEVRADRPSNIPTGSRFPIVGGSGILPSRTTGGSLV
jgi:hypothetical protein